MDIKARKQQENRSNRIRTRLKANNRTGRKRIFFNITNKHLYAQLIDDEAGTTVLTVSTLDQAIKAPGKIGKNKEYAAKLAQLFVEKLKTKSMAADEQYVFDRGGKLFHGRVKVFADALREKGLNF